MPRSLTGVGSLTAVQGDLPEQVLDFEIFDLVMNTNTYCHFYNHYRVNMEDTAVVPNYEGKDKDCYVTAKEENIRPYGILFKEI